MNRLRDLYGRVLSTQDLPHGATDCPVLRIAFSSAERVRSRRVVTRSRFRPTGKYPSWKMERMLQWESINELNAFRLLDCDPNVTVFTEQPCEIVYVDGREIKHHYPDIYVEIDGEQEFWEVKAECEAAQNEVASRTELLSRGLQRYGFTYRVVLDRELAKQQRLENAKTLLRYGRLAASDGEREYIRGAVESKGSLNWAEISLCSPSSSSLLTKQQQHNRRQSDVRCGRAQMMKVRLENVKVRTLKDEMELNYWKQ